MMRAFSICIIVITELLLTASNFVNLSFEQIKKLGEKSYEAANSD